jgi:hypothetical protein
LDNGVNEVKGVGAHVKGDTILKVKVNIGIR